jgi:hypothetical protein
VAITWKRGSVSCLGCMQPPPTHVHGAVSGEIFGHKSVEMLVFSTPTGGYVVLFRLFLLSTRGIFYRFFYTNR